MILGLEGSSWVVWVIMVPNESGLGQDGPNESGLGQDGPNESGLSQDGP